ncbi:MAG: DUF1922 domain-containing protein [Candidatus Stahlbacteria bacterium]|nr:MAG: DUF1922 domain-containing protein [Candidatus Stahlbacteria bacterium]
MKEFECKRCGFLIYLSPKDENEPLCPLCRGTMGETGDEKKTKELQIYKCSECGRTFYVKHGEKPYKCPFCNQTFSLTPRIKQGERL